MKSLWDTSVTDEFHKPIYYTQRKRSSNEDRLSVIYSEGNDAGRRDERQQSRGVRRNSISAAMWEDIN